MQVNSSVIINSYEGIASNIGGNTAIPQGQIASLASDEQILVSSNKASNVDQYQAELERQVGTRNALANVNDGSSQRTIINIGLGGPASLTGSSPSTTDVNNSPLPIDPSTSSSTESSVSDKFLESFSKMLEGFLTNMTKLLDSFLSKIGNGSGNTNTSQATQTGNSGSTPSTTTGSSTSPSRAMKTWEQKASEYLKGDEKGMVAESDLQEAVVKYQIYQKSDQGEAIFMQEMEKAKAATTNRQSALKTALKNTVEAGAITQAEADYVYSISFKASQFDSVVDKISTAKSTGGLSAMNAIQLGGVNLSMIRGGETQVDEMNINTLEA